MRPTFTLSEAFAAIQRVGLLGEHDGGSFTRHVARELGPEAIHDPLTEADVRELVYLARAERRDVRHTQGHAARLEGVFIALDLARDDPAIVRESVAALAARYGVGGVSVEDPRSLRSIFTALGRAFAAAGARERVYLVGRDAPFILVRERLEAVGPFAPVFAFDEPPPQNACPTCGWLARDDDTFCAACRVGLAIGADGRREARAPELARGEAIATWDFRAVPPPGCGARTMRWPAPEGQPADALVPHDEGVVHEIHAAQTATFVEPLLRLRAGCVRFGFSALTPGCRVGIAVRDEPIGRASIRYVLDLAYTTGSLFLARLVVGPGLSAQTALCSNDVSWRLRPLGAPNEIEVRMDGGWLLGYVNDALALRAYDPAYGIGAIGVRVGREADAREPVTRVLLRHAAAHWLEGAP